MMKRYFENFPTDHMTTYIALKEIFSNGAESIAIIRALQDTDRLKTIPDHGLLCQLYKCPELLKKSFWLHKVYI